MGVPSELYIQRFPPKLFKISPTPLLFMLNSLSTCNTQGLVASWSSTILVSTSRGDGLVKEHSTMKSVKVRPLIVDLG